MFFSCKKIVSLIAIYAVALNVIFLGLTPVSATAAATDRFSVICHSIAGTSSGEAPGKSGFIPGHACENCNLCSAAEPPRALNFALAVSLYPARILHVLLPASAPRRTGLTSDPKLARGPPQPA